MEKVNETIKSNLFATDTNTVVAAINMIKVKGNKLYLPILFDLLNSGPEKEIEDEIKELLATVKDKDSIPEFISALKNNKYRKIWKTILTSCWQNGLDFSSSILTFVELLIREEWEIAFEAFTIIDNFEFLPEQKLIEETRKKITAALKTADEQKTYFLQEILTKIS